MQRKTAGTVLCLTLVAFFLGVCQHGTCQEANDKNGAIRKELQKLQGTWSHVSRQVAGKEIVGEDKTALCVVRGNQVVFKRGTNVQQVGVLKIVDATGNPKRMDILITDGPYEGKTVLAIYEVTEDMFRYCASLEARPQTFTTKEGDKGYIFCSTYRRARP